LFGGSAAGGLMLVAAAPSPQGGCKRGFVLHPILLCYPAIPVPVIVLSDLFQMIYQWQQ
jgi:hypothetical protein